MCIRDRVADRPERAGLLARDDLEVGDARPAAGTPIDEGFRAVGQPIAIEPLERHADRAGRAFVHREPEAAPVRRRAEPPLLAEHHLAGGVDELPHPLEVALAAERGAALALRGEDLVCLLYTSDAADDLTRVDLGGRRI